MVQLGAGFDLYAQQAIVRVGIEDNLRQLFVGVFVRGYIGINSLKVLRFHAEVPPCTGIIRRHSAL